MAARLVDGHGEPRRRGRCPPGWPSTCSSAPWTRSSPRSRPRPPTRRQPWAARPRRGAARGPAPPGPASARAAHYGGADRPSVPAEKKAPVSRPPQRRAARRTARAHARSTGWPTSSRCRGWAASPCRPTARRLAILGADARRREEEVAVGAVGGRPGRRARRARRLTRSAPGESAPGWAARRLPAVHLRPARSRSGRRTTGSPKPAAVEPAGRRRRGPAGRSTRPGGIAGVHRRRATAATWWWPPSTMPGAADAEADEERRTQRKDAGVTAVLHEAYPVRYWDHDLGPAAPHLFWAGQLPADEPRRRRGRAAGAARPHARTPCPRTAPATTSRSPPTAAAWRAPRTCPTARRGGAPALVLTETATGATRVLVDDPLADVYAPRFSPDGGSAGLRRASACRPTPSRRTTRCCWSTWPTAAPASSPPGFDRWPSAPQFSADGAAVYFLADDDGRHAIFRVPVDGGDAGAADRRRRLQRPAGGPRRQRPATPSGRATTRPPVPVRLDPAGPAAGARRAAQPRHHRRACPGTLHEVRGDRAPTAPGCSRGWCCPRAPRRSPRRRCCCGSTAAR